MATVFVGVRRDGPKPLPVALKVIREDLAMNRDFVHMFLDEAKIIANLKHPNLVELYERGMDGSRAFLAMELLFGQSLWHVWEACRARGVRLRYDMVAWIGARVAEGLHFAHEMRAEDGQPLDIVHRDVNATNIFVTYDGQVKVIDFGLAKAANRLSKTAAGVIKGKVAYMSPEQAIGAPVDRRTDIFALGTTLWELSVDRRLFKHTDEVETLKRVHAAEVPNALELVDGYPPQLWHVLRRALARERTHRYPTASLFARELDACARIEGRQVTQQVVADVMRELFAEERTRQARWIADASTPERPAPVETLLPRSGFYSAHVGVDVPAIPGPPEVPREVRSITASNEFAPPARPPTEPPTIRPDSTPLLPPAPTPRFAPAEHPDPVVLPIRRPLVTIVLVAAILVCAITGVALALSAH
jgi:serine/threonine-protein kinase